MGVFGIDTVYDWWRLVNLILGALCFVWLIGGLIKQKHQWNTKTRDLWYSRLMYALVAIVLSAEGIGFMRGLTYTLPLVTVAALVTFKGLLIKGSWGYNADETA